MKKAFVCENENEVQKMRKVLNSFFVMMCVIGTGVLLILGNIAAAAEKPEGKEYVNVNPSFSIVIPSWGDDEKEAVDYVALGYGMFKVPKYYVSKAGYYTEESNAESLAKAMMVILKDRYGAKDLNITYTKIIKLSDGTPAYEAGIHWRHPETRLYSSCMWAKKGNTRIAVTISNTDEITDSLKAYMYTLSIK